MTGFCWTSRPAVAHAGSRACLRESLDLYKPFLPAEEAEVTVTLDLIAFRGSYRWMVAERRTSNDYDSSQSGSSPALWRLRLGRRGFDGFNSWSLSGAWNRVIAAGAGAGAI